MAKHKPTDYYIQAFMQNFGRTLLEMEWIAINQKLSKKLCLENPNRMVFFANMETDTQDWKEYKRCLQTIESYFDETLFQLFQNHYKLTKRMCHFAMARHFYRFLKNMAPMPSVVWQWIPTTIM